VKQLRAACQRSEIDLVVYPEGYVKAPADRVQRAVNRRADHLGAPVLLGVATNEGFQVAAYRNPRARGQETPTHLYVKHSSPPRLAFEWPNYAGPRDAMFLPICLRGWSLGVQICHDMYFGLVGQLLRHAGATAFINLTGGNVVAQKWANVMRGRSLELNGPFLCTMARDPARSGASRALAFDQAQPMRLAAWAPGMPAGEPGGYAVVELGSQPFSVLDEQGFSLQSYDDVTVAVGTGKDADLVVARTADGMTLSGRQPERTVGEWRGFATRHGRMGVLLLGLEEMRDGLALYHAMPPEGVFDHHLVVYQAPQSPVNRANCLTLLKLRAIEHRIGAMLVAGEVHELVKTDQYKKIRRLQERDRCFGLNARNLGVRGAWPAKGRGKVCRETVCSGADLPAHPW